MRLIFCGTPTFAVPALRRLVAAGHRVELVVTQPDRPKGRAMAVTPSPVKEAALELGLPLTQPEKIKDNEEFRRQAEQLRPAAIIVVGYGRIIPKWMLDLPPHGNINLHASLLPRYRGAAPIQWAIANGEHVSGNTTMRIDSGLDTGAILLQQEVPIGPSDTALTYGKKLSAAGADLIERTLAALEQRAISPTPQDDARASLAPILRKEDGRVNFSWTAEKIWNRLRGFQPWPGVFTSFRGKKLDLIVAEPWPAALGLAPAEMTLHEGKMLVGCGEGTTLTVHELQPEGKRRMSAKDFANGYRLQAGERFEH